MRKRFINNQELQKRVRSWWNTHPFTYFVDPSTGSGRGGEEGSWEFFRNIDRKFLKWIPFAQDGGYPFLTNFIDMRGLRGKQVLDIACGTGVLTEQFVRMGANVTAIDITPKAVELTRKRLALYNLKAEMLEADAQKMPFANSTFDFVCAWGCLMHMPETPKAISEIYRVLKPGGTVLAMMYHKNSVHLRLAIQFSKGILQLQYLRYDNQSLINRHTDGFLAGGNELAKFYSRKEFRRLFSVFSNVAISTHDNPGMPEQLPHPWLPIGKLLPKCIKGWICHTFGMTAIIVARK